MNSASVWVVSRRPSFKDAPLPISDASTVPATHSNLCWQIDKNGRMTLRMSESKSQTTTKARLVIMVAAVFLKAVLKSRDKLSHA